MNDEGFIIGFGFPLDLLLSKKSSKAPSTVSIPIGGSSDVIVRCPASPENPIVLKNPTARKCNLGGTGDNDYPLYDSDLCMRFFSPKLIQP